MSKFFNYLSVALLGASVVVGFTACHDEDLDVSEATLKQKAYDNAFINQFGKPDPNQSWDFYAQAIDGLKNNAGTRASGAGWSVNPRTNQPAYITPAVVARYNDILPEGKNNYLQGQSEYDLYSTGKFTISAIWYGGKYETDGGFETHVYICFYDDNNVYHEEKLFDSVSNGGYRNPGLSCDVELPVGRKFWFKMTTKHKSGWGNDILDFEEHDFYTVNSHIKDYDYEKIPNDNYPNGWTDPDGGVGMPYGFHNFDHKANDYYHHYMGPSMLMYDEVATTYGDTEIERYMVIGFEDCWENVHWLDFDYNDLVLYIDGKLPVPVAKRFMMEDLTTYDFDFNDVVVDLEYKRAVLRAVGGIQPVFIVLNDPHGGDEPLKIVSDELHEWMWKNQPGNTTHTLTDDRWYVDDAHPKGKYFKPINVDAENGVTLVPVLLNQWDIPLTDNQLRNFPKEFDDMQLMVFDNENWLPWVDVFKGGETPKAGVAGPMVVNPVDAENCPAIMTTSVETRWMKEFETITKSYPTFWKGNNPSSDQDYNNLWYNYNVNNAYVYNP